MPAERDWDPLLALLELLAEREEAELPETLEERLPAELPDALEERLEELPELLLRDTLPERLELELLPLRTCELLELELLPLRTCELPELAALPERETLELLPEERLLEELLLPLRTCDEELLERELLLLVERTEVLLPEVEREEPPLVDRDWAAMLGATSIETASIKEAAIERNLLIAS